MLCGVRGAVSIEENSAQAIRQGVAQLIETLITKNRIEAGRIVSVFFTVTPDLTAYNPARAIREVRNDWQAVPMMCSQEPVIDNMLARCIRVLIQWNATENQPGPVPVYLGETVQLRPDWA
jgi:chorismate mutase